MGAPTQFFQCYSFLCNLAELPSDLHSVFNDLEIEDIVESFKRTAWRTPSPPSKPKAKAKSRVKCTQSHKRLRERDDGVEDSERVGMMKVAVAGIHRPRMQTTDSSQWGHEGSVQGQKPACHAGKRTDRGEDGRRHGSGNPDP